MTPRGAAETSATEKEGPQTKRRGGWGGSCSRERGGLGAAAAACCCSSCRCLRMCSHLAGDELPDKLCADLAERERCRLWKGEEHDLVAPRQGRGESSLREGRPRRGRGLRGREGQGEKEKETRRREEGVEAQKGRHPLPLSSLRSPGAGSRPPSAKDTAPHRSVRNGHGEGQVSREGRGRSGSRRGWERSTDHLAEEVLLVEGSLPKEVGGRHHGVRGLEEYVDVALGVADDVLHELLAAVVLRKGGEEGEGGGEGRVRSWVRGSLV